MIPLRHAFVKPPSSPTEIWYYLQVKSVLFDYGGTLDADGTPWIERFRPIYKEAGLDTAPERFDRAFYDAEDLLPTRHRLAGLDLEATVRLQVADTIAVLAPSRVDLVNPIAGRFASDCRKQFERLRPSLDRLAGKYRLGVVSNFYGNLDGILAAEGLRGHFAVVADSGVLGVMKPDAGIFLHACAGVKAEPRDCVMVGDSTKRDIPGGKALGMKTALIAPGEAPSVGQDWTISSVLELEGVIS